MTIVIPAYSLQKVPYLLQCNEKRKKGDTFEMDFIDLD